MIDLIKIRI